MLVSSLTQPSLPPTISSTASSGTAIVECGLLMLPRCVPSGLRIEQLIEAFTISSHFFSYRNRQPTEVPSQVAKYLAGGCLIALEKN